MEVVRRWWWLLLLVVLIAAWAAFCRSGGANTAGQTTRLEIESVGGFQYVPTRSDHTLEIAYLNDVNVPGCVVDQVGTHLVVVDGTIVDPSPPADKTFDLEGAVVTFPALESANLPMTAVRGSRPAAPFRPANTADPTQWADLKWVPGLAPDFPSSSLNPEWRTMVDGRMVLKGGTVKAMHPTDLVMQNALFVFKTVPQAARSFTQAVTDRVQYEVDVPEDRVVMHLSNAASGINRIVVVPSSPGRTVRLKLMGLHSDAKAVPALDAPLTDYCAFYQLMQPVPPQSDWLIPHFTGNPAFAGNRAGQPSPGPYCPGQWCCD